MDQHATPRSRRDAVWLTPQSGDLESFKALVSTRTQAADWPLACAIERDVPVYSGADVRRAAADDIGRKDLMAEWACVFEEGPGIIVIKNAIEDAGVVDRATRVFEGLIESERATGGGGGDHFAKPGANDRVWNAAQKHCLADPEGFAAYFASDAIALASEAWLGQGYQVTAQVNRVNPGGAAQTPHRDYHLGFMSPEAAARYPALIHRLSPVLTLQGAIAHVDMPLSSGPTLYLPYSQLFFEGYVAFGRPEFQEYFRENHVQLPLEKGDAVFFNPALMHGAGTNRSTDILRMANLLQVGSGFGRSIEAVDRTRMATTLYPVLAGGGLSARARTNVIAASAEGYPFPTNLDTDPPVGGLAPLSQAAIMAECLNAGVPAADFLLRMEALAARRAP